MKFSSILLIAAICTSQTTLARESPSVGIQKQQQTLYEHDKELISWYTEGIRGLYFGFFRGLFHDMKRPSPQCLSKNMDDQLTNILQFLAYGELADIFQVADSITSLYYDNKRYCGEYILIETFMGRCSGSHKDDCKPLTLFNNLFVKNMVAGLGAISVLADAVRQFTIQVDADVLYEEMLSIGKNFGAVVAYIIDI